MFNIKLAKNSGFAFHSKWAPAVQNKQNPNKHQPYKLDKIPPPQKTIL